jgi:drug/metabolite transporter (DMT)-like permease
VIAGVFTALALAFVPICVRLSEVGPVATGFYRFFLSFPFLMTWMVFDHIKDPAPKTPRTQKDYYLIWGAGAFLALDLIFWHWSMMRTTVVNAMLLSNLTPIFTALASWFLFREKLTWPIMVALMMAIAGSTILVGGTFAVDADHLVGDIMAFISSLFFTAFLLSVKELRHHFRSPTIMAWGAIPTMYILAVTAYMSHEVLVPQTPSGWGILFFMALFIHICGQGLLTFSMAHMSATLSALLMSLSPVFAAILAWFFFQESLGIYQIIGGGVILSGVLIARIPQAKERNS